MNKLTLLLLFTAILSSVYTSVVVLRNPGCNAYDSSGVCTSCATRFYKDQNNICQPVNPNCKTYNEFTGACLSCYTGFGLIEDTCLPGVSDVQLDLNCNKFQNNVCTKCSFGFYFDQLGRCTKADPSCQTFNELNGACTSCYIGFVVSGGKCVRQATRLVDVNCNQFDANNVCIKCSSGFYFKQGVCTKIQDTCKNFDTNAGICTACYSGYTLNQLYQCVKEEAKSNPNPYCAEWKDSLCLRCAQGTLFDRFGICTLLDTNCKEYQSQTSICRACYDGYNLLNGSCIKAVAVVVSDPYCNTFVNGLCTKCSTGYYFNQKGLCTQIDDNCKLWNNVILKCTQCYSGYQLNIANECIKVIEASVTDVNCAEWNGKICKKCSFGSDFNVFGICTVLDTQCKEYDQSTKLCKACYTGYELNNLNSCVKSALQSVSDPLCAEWLNNICLKCSFASYMNPTTKLCTPIDTSCKNFNSQTGVCISCYDGYQLNIYGTCVKVIEEVSDVNCAQWKGKVCLRCSFGAAFNYFGRCQILDTQCKQYDQITGLCKSCYTGYQLNNLNTCVQQVAKTVSDLLCAEWKNEVCTKCSFGSYFGSAGKCIQYDSTCKSVNQSTGLCLSCYDGYELNSFKTCVKSVIAEVRDSLCAQWNGTLCVRCAQGAYFNALKVCTQVDSLCSSFNKITGECLSCFAGYDLSIDKKCVKSTLLQSSNALCSQWDNVNKICVKCSTGSFFNNIGVCQKVDPLCKTFNALNGACTSCFDGYAISGSSCIVSKQASRDPLCKSFNGTVCIECSFGAFFGRNGVCQLSDSSCLTYNPANGLCLSCYSGYVIVNGKCQVDKNNLLTDPYCAEFKNSVCNRCSDGYYFEKDGKCTAVDPLCATYNPLNGRCLSCYTGFQLYSGLCIVAVQAAKDPNCASFDKQVCLLCSKGFIFNDKGACVLANPLCKTYDQITGACLTCYNGYIISGFTCAIDKSAESSNCAEYVDNVCVRCASRTFLNSKKQCEKVNENCRTYNDFTGACLSCYSGYSLSLGACYKSEAQGGCAEFDTAGRCTKCSNGYYISNNSYCSIIDAQCANFNLATKNCDACYAGYTLLEGRCQIAKVNQEYEVKNCVAYNVQNKCIQCFDRFYLSNNQCKDVSIFCKTYDIITGFCTTCYSGFSLLSGQCKK